MMSSTTANYSFASKEIARDNLRFRFAAAHAMMRIDGLSSQGYPAIDFGYASTPQNRKIDTTYWQPGQGPAPEATTKAQVNRWKAVTTGLEGGVTRLECLAAMHSAYYIAAANILGEAKFNARFAQAIGIGGDHGTPFVDFSTPWIADGLGGLNQRFNVLRNAYVAGIAVRGVDPAWAEKIDKVRGEIKGIADKLITPLTGDQVYFSNSRFYTAIYPDGAWQGENTIAFVDKDGNLGYTGMGTSPKTDGIPQNLEQMKALLLKTVNGEPGKPVPKALQDFKNALAARKDVKDAAAAKGLTATQYVDQVMSKAAEVDIGILGFGVAVL